MALLALAFGAASAQADIYWANFQDAFGEGTESFIGHARLNGSEANADFLPVGLTHPYRMAADGEFIYSSFLTKDGGGIGRARLNGSEHDLYFITEPGPAPLPNGTDGVAVTSKYIYWSSWYGDGDEENEIGRARIDGSEIIPDFITLPSNIHATDMTVVGDHIIYGEIGAIGRVNVDGAEDEPEYIKSPEHGPGVGFVWGVAANSHYIYWTGSGSSNSIGRVENVAGGSIEPEFISGLEETGTGGLALDSEHIYWANEGGEAIGRATLAGGSVEEQWVPDAGDPQGLAIDRRIVVNSTAEYKDANPGDGICAAKEHESLCTLRAAIEEVNAAKNPNPIQVAVEIPGGKLETISLKEELPKIESPIDLDARSQPGALVAGTRKIGLILSGAALSGAKANGLELGPEAGESTIAGLQVQGFSGDGVLLEGEHQELADSVLTADTTGAEVAANNDILGSGNELPGDIFYADGRAGLVKFLEGLAHKKDSIGEFESAADVFGADVAMSKPSSGTRIVGDDIGIHGPGFSASPDKLEEDGLSTTYNVTGAVPIGVLIAPAKEGDTISNVTIGGTGEAADVDSGTLFGVMAIGGAKGSAINGLSVLGTSFGDDTTGKPLEPLGGLFGVFAAGAVNGVQIGLPGEGNTFQGQLIGALLAGQELHSVSLQGNSFGASLAVGELSKGLEGHTAIGVSLADVQGAQIGGTSTGQGNHFPGSVVSILMSGLHLANDSVVGNTIGTAPSTPFTTFTQYPENYSTIMGLLIGDLSPGFDHVAAQGLTVSGNTFQGSTFGLFAQNIKGLVLTGNTIQDDAFGMFDSGSGGEQIGKPGEGNSFFNDGLALFDASEDPKTREDEQAGLNAKDSEPSTRTTYLNAPDESLAFDGVDAITTAELSESSANTSAQPGEDNSIVGNRFGVDGSGTPHPDELPLLIGGDEHSLRFGGTGAGQGNVVEDNRSGGLLLAGKETHVPTVQVLGNTIYNNESFTSTIPIPGLGINLLGEEGFGAGVLGVDPQDPTQPDGGPNRSQNAPVLTSAQASGGTLTLAGTLHGVAATNYLLEIFADENANPFGAGEGEMLLERITLSTDASGNAAFTSTVGTPPSAYRYVSSTATTVPGGGEPGVTSEFSIDQPIATEPTVTPSTTTTTTSTSTATTTSTSPPPSLPKGAESTTLTTKGSSASTSGPTVTLPVSASCSSATASPCTVTSTATIPSTGAAKTSFAATLASGSAHAARGKPPLMIAHGSMSLARGATAPLRLSLTKRGLALLRAHHTLAITLTVKISGPGRATVVRTLHIKLKFKQPAKSRR